MALLEVEGVSKRFGGLVAVDRVSFSVEPGAIVGLIGPNGAGKTTLFNLLTGVYLPDRGEVRFGTRRITRLRPHARCRLGLSRTFQLVRPFPEMTVLGNVAVGAVFGARPRPRDAAERRAREVLDLVGLADRASEPVDALTLADRRRLELARALAAEPTLLLLDEVMAGLTPTEVAQLMALVGRIHALGVTLMVVEHVMQAVMALSHRVMVLSSGAKIAEGTPAEVTRDPRVIESYLGQGAARA